MATHRIRYLKKMGLNPKESYGLDDLAEISGIKESILQEVYDRGIGAWKTNPSSVRQLKNPQKRGGPKSKLMTPEQWAYARVYSFLNNGKTAKTADKDLKEKTNELKREPTVLLRPLPNRLQAELLGGGDSLETKEELEDVKEYALSNSDIENLIGKTNIFTYPELENIRHIDEVFRKGKNGVETAIMLYLTDDDKTGHWIALIKKGNTIEMYDPYGNKPEKLNKEVGGAMNSSQKMGLLREKVENSGYNLIHNSKQVQPISPDINTCGRHAVMRVMFGHLPLDEYHKKINKLTKENGVSIDDLATALTFDFLGK